MRMLKDHVHLFHLVYYWLYVIGPDLQHSLLRRHFHSQSNESNDHTNNEYQSNSTNPLKRKNVHVVSITDEEQHSKKSKLEESTPDSTVTGQLFNAIINFCCTGISRTTYISFIFLIHVLYLSFVNYDLQFDK
jgi:hypothetical protein